MKTSTISSRSHRRNPSIWPVPSGQRVAEAHAAAAKYVKAHPDDILGAENASYVETALSVAIARYACCGEITWRDALRYAGLEVA